MGVLLATVPPNRRIILLRAAVRAGVGLVILLVGCSIMANPFLHADLWLLVCLGTYTLFLTFLFAGLWELQYLTQFIELYEGGIVRHDKQAVLIQLKQFVWEQEIPYRVFGILPTGYRYERFSCEFIPHLHGKHHPHETYRKPMVLSGLRFAGLSQTLLQTYEGAVPCFVKVRPARKPGVLRAILVKSGQKKTSRTARDKKNDSEIK